MAHITGVRRPARTEIRVAVGLLSAAFILLLPGSSASAAEQWNDGTLASSTQVKCVINLQETGALAKAGYRADPAQLPKVGDVFYGRADFGAVTDAACGDVDQIAELDIVPPPGVSLAIDAAHPIRCLYADDGRPEADWPTCPTHSITGAYGPAIASDEAGDVWPMPRGREYDIQFPLRSDRRLLGGGTCPQSVDDIPTSVQRDCLLIALHVVDGYADPWLAPSEQLFVDPAAPGSATGPGPGPTSSPGSGPGPAPTPVVSRIAFHHSHLAAVAKKGLELSVTCAAACRGTIKVRTDARTAKRLRLAKRPLTLARGTFSAAAGRTATVHLKVAKRVAVKLRRLKSLRVTVTATPARSPATTTRLTLRR